MCFRNGKKIFTHIFSGVLFLVVMVAPLSLAGQAIPDSYGNNPASVKWRYLQTPHFKIVFHAGQKMAAVDVARQAEPIYQEYKQRLGTVPSQKNIAVR
jgi:hypothetical protein